MPELMRHSVLMRQLMGEDAAKVSHFATYLREVFQPGTEPMIMEVAAATLGHLVKSGGALTADIVEFEVYIRL
jgi:FKBP12-rapamycin complex-associated protein